MLFVTFSDQAEKVSKVPLNVLLDELVKWELSVLPESLIVCNLLLSFIRLLLHIIVSILLFSDQAEKVCKEPLNALPDELVK
jgi:hypothetical protein